MNKIEPSLIANPPSNIDDYICKICTFILNHPYECENCGTPYCRDCIEEWNKISSQCPLKCGSTLNIKPAHRFIKKMLGDLDVKCPNKCEVIVKMEHLDKHNNECQFLLVRCENTECEEYYIRKDLKNHLGVCKYKEHICETCNDKIKLYYNDVKIHNCINTLSNKFTILNTRLDELEKIIKISEKDIRDLKYRTGLLLSNISYKCDNGHHLIFRANWTSTCSCCGLIKICTRWECSNCNKYYCLDCIRLLNHLYCPNSHTFIYGNRGNFLCDICGAKKTYGGPLSLHDPVCDFDLCELCSVKVFPDIGSILKV